MTDTLLEYLPLGEIILIAAIVLPSLFFGLRSLRYTCRPNEILIFAGRKHKARDGRTVGYRVVFSGRAWRMPVVETVDRMDMTTIPVELQVKNAYSKGGIPLNVAAVANVKISGDEGLVMNAIERFLGKPRDEIGLMVKEILEGGLRSLLAKRTPEEVDQNRLKVAERLAAEAEEGLYKLGIQLEMLQIQEVHDDRNYLNNISGGQRRGDGHAGARSDEALFINHRTGKERE